MKFKVAVAGLENNKLLIEAETPWDAAQEYKCQNRLPANGWLIVEGDHIGSFQIVNGVLQQTESEGRHEPDPNSDVVHKNNDEPVAELTTEERQKIYAEEKARLEAQQQIKREAEEEKARRNNSSQKAGFLGLVALVVLICIGYTLFNSDNNKAHDERPGKIQIPPNSGITLNSYDLLENPYQYKGRLIILNHDCLDANGMRRYLILDRMISESTALYNVMRHPMYGDPLKGQIAVELPEGTTRLDLDHGWMVEPLGTLDGTNGFGAPISIPYVRFWRYAE